MTCGPDVRTGVCVRPARPQWAAGLEHHEPRVRCCDWHRCVAGRGACWLWTRLEQGQWPWEAGRTGFTPTLQWQEGPGSSDTDQWPHLHPEHMPRPHVARRRQTTPSLCPSVSGKSTHFRTQDSSQRTCGPFASCWGLFKIKTWDLVLGASAGWGSTWGQPFFPAVCCPDNFHGLCVTRPPVQMKTVRSREAKDEPGCEGRRGCTGLPLRDPTLRSEPSGVAD